MKKVLVFIDYNFYYDYLDAHNIEYDEYDPDPKIMDIGNAFTGQKKLPLESCGMDYMILDCNVSEYEALEIIDKRLKCAYGVENLEGVLHKVEFWPHFKCKAIPNLSLKTPAPKPTKESLLAQGVPLFKVEIYLTLNFWEDYEDDYLFLKQEDINMPAYQFEREIALLDEVIEIQGFNIICRDLPKVLQFIEDRLPVLAGAEEMCDIGYLIWSEYPPNP